MKAIRSSLLLAALALGALAPAGLAPAPALAADAVDLRKELISSLNAAGDKIVELAEATPEAKYAWSPAKGVRTTGQVFVHVVAANYMLPMMFAGKKPPVTEDLRALEEHPPAKAKLVQMMKDSFKYAGDCIAAMSDADLAGTARMFDGSDGSKMSLLLVTVSHAHEHLGQSIAYARGSGIVPPWTAREEAEAKKAQEGKK